MTEFVAINDINVELSYSIVFFIASEWDIITDSNHWEELSRLHAGKTIDAVDISHLRLSDGNFPGP